MDLKSWNNIYVLLAEAGIQQVIDQYTSKSLWIPAFTGMTRKWDSSGAGGI